MYIDIDPRMMLTRYVYTCNQKIDLFLLRSRGKLTKLASFDEITIKVVYVLISRILASIKNFLYKLTAWLFY